MCVCVCVCAVRLVCQRGIEKWSHPKLTHISERMFSAFHIQTHTLESGLHLKSRLYLRRLRATALITHWACVCVCVCILEKTQTGLWDRSACVFWLCQADHYGGVQGQVVRPEGPDVFVCLGLMDDLLFWEGWCTLPSRDPSQIIAVHICGRADGWDGGENRIQQRFYHSPEITSSCRNSNMKASPLFLQRQRATVDFGEHVICRREIAFTW